jgi:HD-GYP domain-containing protein (c-di-GMP phosphodiesterase class II)
MAIRDSLKRISIDQVIPGMFVVEMDVPWYQTPFFSHKQLIKEHAAIQTMKRCGIRMVTIDVSKGKDVPCAVPADRSDQDAAVGPGTDALNRVSDRTIEPQIAPESDSAQSLYRESQEAVERIFADLEQGVPPPAAATQAVVSRVLARILDDRAPLLTQMAVQKMKQFDHSLAAHALDACILALIVGVESGLDETLQTYLGQGALLHDAGYVRLPRNLVRRRDECEDRERTLLRQHPTLGLSLLAEESSHHDEVRRIVVEHHELKNGSGFPGGKKDGAISPLAAIVGIVDWYDGMVSRRGGRPAMLPHEAVRQLFLAGELGRFDKSLAETLIRSIGVYPVGSLVRLNTGEQAVVIGINPGQRLKPLVKIIKGPNGESYPTPPATDLAADPQGQAPRTVQQVLNPAQERVNIALYFDEPSEQAA